MPPRNIWKFEATYIQCKMKSYANQPLVWWGGCATVHKVCPCIHLRKNEWSMKYNQGETEGITRCSRLHLCALVAFVWFRISLYCSVNLSSETFSKNENSTLSITPKITWNVYGLWKALSVMKMFCFVVSVKILHGISWPVMYNFMPELHVKYISKLVEHPKFLSTVSVTLRLIACISVNLSWWQIYTFPFSLANKTSLIIFILEHLFFQYPSWGQYTVHLHVKHLNQPGTWGHLKLPSDSKFFGMFTSDFAGLVSSDFIKIFLKKKKILTSAILMMHNQAKSSVTFQTALSKL